MHILLFQAIIVNCKVPNPLEDTLSSPADLIHRLEFAVDLARKAGDVTLEHFQTDLGVERKADSSPVTVADRGAERLMRELIEAEFPADGILGEEYGETRPGAAGRWILDPIDGTRSFARGVPLYGVLIAYEAAGRSVLGVLHFPALGETVYAARGEGCWWNEKEARVSEVDRLEDAVVLTTTVEGLADAGFGDAWSDLAAHSGKPVDSGARGAGGGAPEAGGGARGAGYARTWGDCYGYALVATGRAEVMVDPRMHLWDVAPLVPVIEEAGGVFTDWQGRTGHNVTNAIATNARLAEDVRKILAREPG